MNTKPPLKILENKQKGRNVNHIYILDNIFHCPKYTTCLDLHKAIIRHSHKNIPENMSSFYNQKSHPKINYFLNWIPKFAGCRTWQKHS